MASFFYSITYHKLLYFIPLPSFPFLRLPRPCCLSVRLFLRFFLWFPPFPAVSGFPPYPPATSAWPSSHASVHAIKPSRLLPDPPPGLLSLQGSAPRKENPPVFSVFNQSPGLPGLRAILLFTRFRLIFPSGLFPCGPGPSPGLRPSFQASFPSFFSSSFVGAGTPRAIIFSIRSSKKFFCCLRESAGWHTLHARDPFYPYSNYSLSFPAEEGRRRSELLSYLLFA